MRASKIVRRTRERIVIENYRGLIRRPRLRGVRK